MWWILVIGAVVVILGFFEWRSRNKPLARGLQNGQAPLHMPASWGFGDKGNSSSSE